MQHTIWKLIHLLFRTGSATLADLFSTEDPNQACVPDALVLMETSGIVSNDNGTYRLTDPMTKLLSHCTVAKQHGGAIGVDTAVAFVIMPYEGVWDELYDNFIEPAVTNAGLDCWRADKGVQAGVLTDKMVEQILGAGICIAEVTTPNPNVFYEVGFAHAIGKETILLLDKQQNPDAPLLPSDIKGWLYQVYDRNDLGMATANLTAELKKWADRHRVKKVSSLIALGSTSS
jgi:hypothetical protein